jgi:hypothetical protein
VQEPHPIDRIGLPRAIIAPALDPQKSIFRPNFFRPDATRAVAWRRGSPISRNQS